MPTATIPPRSTPPPAATSKTRHTCYAATRHASRNSSTSSASQPHTQQYQPESRPYGAGLTRGPDFYANEILRDQDSRGDPQLPGRIFVEDFRRSTLVF